MWIRPRFKRSQVAAVRGAAVWYLPLSSCFRRDVIGIASVTSAMTAQRHWTRLSPVMGLIRMSTARRATASDGDLTAMDSPVAPDFFNRIFREYRIDDPVLISLRIDIAKISKQRGGHDK